MAQSPSASLQLRMQPLVSQAHCVSMAQSPSASLQREGHEPGVTGTAGSGGLAGKWVRRGRLRSPAAHGAGTGPPVSGQTGQWQYRQQNGLLLRGLDGSLWAGACAAAGGAARPPRPRRATAGACRSPRVYWLIPEQGAQHQPKSQSERAPHREAEEEVADEEATQRPDPDPCDHPQGECLLIEGALHTILRFFPPPSTREGSLRCGVA